MTRPSGVSLISGFAFHVATAAPQNRRSDPKARHKEQRRIFLAQPMTQLPRRGHPRANDRASMS
eukprot:5571701-Pyramimonas_sp.AAC.1